MSKKKKVEEIDHGARGHAEFSPSQMKYLRVCPAYQGTSGTNSAAEKGTRIHEALEARDPSALHDEEEVRIYQQIADEEDSIIAAFFGDETMLVEKEILLDIEHDAETPQFGSLDFFARNGVRAIAIDYKTGFGKIDEPLENDQARDYVLGLFQRYPDLEEITFIFIVPMRNETLTGKFTRDMMDELRAQTTAVIAAAEKVRPKWLSGQPELEECNPSVNCRFCRYESRCPALGALALDLAHKYGMEHEDDSKLKKKSDLLPDGPVSSSETHDPKTLEKLYIVATIVLQWAEGIKHKAVTFALEEGDDQFDHLKLRNLGAPKETKDGKGLIALGVEHGLERDEIIDWEKAVSLTRVLGMAKENAPKGEKAGVARELEAEAFARQVVERGKPRYTLAMK